MKVPFGVLPGGRAVEAITLGAADGLQAEILTYGGILRRLVLPARGARRDLVLTLPNLDAYVRDSAYLGVLVGRVANRIAGARFELNGKPYPLTVNQAPNHLHGGLLGFGKRLWRVLDMQTKPTPTLLLGLRSPAGEEGYPGNLDVTAEFTVEANELRLRFEARCDTATPLNLTYHPYFNLSGEPRRSAEEQELRISADDYLPVVDSHLIPTGDIESVRGTPFDFRTRHSIRSPALASHPQLTHGAGFDHSWVLDRRREWDAELYSPHSGVTMTLHSARPALQFYGGQYLAHEHAGLHGVCLEPQGFPNSVNESGFPSDFLAAGITYRSAFRYRFSATSP